MYPHTKSKTRSANDLFSGAYAMFCARFFFLIFFLKAYVVGTHLNCIDKFDAIQMSTHNICLYKEVDKKYTGCNLKTTELRDCAYRGMCGN